MVTSNCCGCFSLRTGTIIIGWLFVVGNIFSLGAKFTAMSSGEASSNIYSSWSSIILCALQMIVAIVLLYGVYYSHKQSVYWFVMAESFLIFVNIIAVIVAILSAGHAFSAVLIFVVSTVVVFFIQVYYIVVVYSFYKEM